MGDHLTDLEQLLLMATLRVGEGAYGAAIQEDLEEAAERAVSLGSLYMALARLEERGFVRSTLGDPTPRRGGRSKRLYEVTPDGRAAVAHARAVRERMWRGVPPAEEGA